MGGLDDDPCTAWGPVGTGLARILTNANVISGHPCLNRTARAGDKLVLGDDALPAIPTVIGTGLPSGSPAMVLQAELNRFGDLFGAPLELDGKIDATSANGAQTISRTNTIVTKRALDLAFDPSLSTTSIPFLSDASSIIPTPDGAKYVIANLPLLTAIVAGYADVHGLPAAAMPLSLPTVALVVLAGVGLYILTGSNKPRRRSRR